MPIRPRGATYLRRCECLAAAMVLAGCSSGDAMSDLPGAPVDPPVTTTFHKDVEPIVQKSCQGCHVTGGLAPFSLTSYASARPWASLMVTETATRRMPPWGAQDTAECKPPHPWQKDARLSEADIATFAAWAAA